MLQAEQLIAWAVPLSQTNPKSRRPGLKIAKVWIPFAIQERGNVYMLLFFWVVK